MKHIVLILPDLRVGGVEKMAIMLANWFSGNNYKVHILCLFSQSSLEYLVSPNVNVTYLRKTRILASLLSVVRFLRCSQPDYVIARMWPLTLIAIAAKLLCPGNFKLLVSDHTNFSSSILNETKFPLWLARVSLRLFYPLANLRVVPSFELSKQLSCLGWIKLSSIDVIPNPACPLSDGKTISQTKEFVKFYNDPKWPANRKYRLLTVCTLKEQKNIPLLLDSVELLLLLHNVDVELVILGDGPMRPKLELIIQSKGLQGTVSLLGLQDPRYWYETCDLFVLSSSWEGFANVLVEALFYGVPVVSTDCPYGPSEIIDSPSLGRLVKVNSKVDLSLAINECLITQFDVNVLRNHALRFSVNAVANDYIQLFERT